MDGTAGERHDAENSLEGYLSRPMVLPVVVVASPELGSSIIPILLFFEFRLLLTSIFFHILHALTAQHLALAVEHALRRPSHLSPSDQTWQVLFNSRYFSGRRSDMFLETVAANQNIARGCGMWDEARNYPALICLDMVFFVASFLARPNCLGQINEETVRLL